MIEILFYINFLSLIVGCLLGYLLGSYLKPKVSEDSESRQIKPDISRKKQTNTNFHYKPEPISIDSKTFVVKTNTTDLEKKYTDITKTTQSDESISESVNKLKNFKK